MKVTVNVTGFYAGNYHKSGAEIELHDKVAKQFLPPYGSQLSVAPNAKLPAKVDGKAS